MKRIITILFVLLSAISFCQVPVPAPVIQRSTAGNTVQDARLFAQFNLGAPRYLDTTAANTASNISIDSCFTIIGTYADNALWVRACNPKRWLRVGNGGIVPDGTFTGGDVAYSGVNLDFIVSPYTAVFNGQTYSFPQRTVTLSPSDPTFDRLDDIVLTPTGATSITGVPASNPQEPSINPQTQIRRALVSIPAGSLTPGGITQNSVFDQDLGLPDEWTPSATAATVNFADATFPYHLTIDADVSVITTASSIDFNFSDTVNTSSVGTFVTFVRLGSIMAANQNINVQLYYLGNPVSNILNFTSFGGDRNIVAGYQAWIIPTIQFGNANVIFDQIKYTVTGSGTFPHMWLDYIQFQKGFAQFFPQQVTIVGLRTDDNNIATATQPNDIISILGANGITTSSTAKTVTIDGTKFIRNDIYYNAPQAAGISVDNYIRITNPNIQNSILDVQGNRGNLEIENIQDNRATGNGPNGGYFIHPISRFIAPNMVDGHAASIYVGKSYTTYGTMILQYMQKNIAAGASGVGAGFSFFGTPDVPFFFWADSMLVVGRHDFRDPANRFKLDVNGDARFNNARCAGCRYFQLTDSSYVPKNIIDSLLGASVGYNSNIGAGLRLVQVFTKNIKTLFGSYALNGDSTTNTNGITYKIDTTLIATRAFAQSLVPGGVTGVTSVGKIDGSGFAFTITNPTSTPVISLTTSLTQNRIPFIGASGALSQDAGLAWDATNKRIQSWLSPPAGTATAGTSPLKFTAGTNLSVIENGAWEFDGTHLYFSIAGVRIQIDNPGSLGVLSAIGTANQVNVSSATGNVTFSLPQSIAITSAVQFGRLTLGGTAATSPLTFITNTDATASAGRWYYNTTRLGFALGGTILRVPLTNDVTPSNGQTLIWNNTTGNYTVSALSPKDNTVTITNGAGSITLGLNLTPQTLTDGATITWNGTNGFNAQVTLGGTGRTLTITNAVSGATYTLRIVQDGTGNRTITTWPATVKWPNGAAPVLSTAAGAINIVSFVYYGTTPYGAYTNAPYQ